MNGKIFRFLPTDWELEAAVMEEAKNLKMLDVDEFICSLIAHKGKIKLSLIKERSRSLRLKIVEIKRNV